MTPFSKAIITCDHNKCINYGYENFCALCSFRAVLREYVGSCKDAISPYVIFNNLEKISSDFEKFFQEDAHSFFSFFLDKLEIAYLKHYNKRDGDGLILQTFGIHLRNMAKCLQCDYTAVSSEFRFDLSFDIQEANSLEDALKEFVQVKRITDPDLKRTCESCNEKVFMDEQIIIDNLPMVIVVHLHGSDVNDGEFSKLYKDVSFPMTMNFMPYTSTFQDELYELYAVVVHKGGALCGHYFSFIRSYPDSWYLMEDSKVERVSVEYVFQHNPFLLFYIKQGKSFCFSKLCKQFGSPTSTLDGLEVHGDLSNDLENRSSCDDLKNCVEETLREAGECSQRLSDEHAPFDDDQDFAQEHEPCSSDRSRSGETETCKPSSSDKRFDETEISSHPFSPQNDVIKTAVCESSDLPGYSKQKLRSLDFVADEVYEEDETVSLACTTLFKSKKVVLPVAKTANVTPISSTLNTMMRSMPNSRRRALISCMHPQFTSSPGLQVPAKKKKRQM
ncbi:hypothetical protein ZOSMA_26G00990 [Zostera marina]|uniref:USP domain-containing protein n=1 Tax=Zostera marina TaxID=29655 RepID=A0A0K9PGK0_ZOSMR|nr:hypothetical protein ZOSMA_26G00990 [Zostera marina]